MIKIRNARLLNWTVYLIVLIMVSISIIVMPGGPKKTAVIALCIAFGLVHAIGFRLVDIPRWLAVYLLIQTLLILALLRLSSPHDFLNFFFYILAIETAIILPARAALPIIVSFFLLDSLNALWNQGTKGITGVLFYAAAFILTPVFGIALRHAEIAQRKNQELIDELKATQHQLQDLAVNEERTRMAREMHDALGHRLTVTIVQLEGARRLIPIDPERAGRMIEAMRDEVKEALTELRRTVTALRAPIVGNLPLEMALSNLSQTFQQKTGTNTHFSVSPGFPGLPESYRLALYRAAQEALTNTQRHAMARNAWLSLSTDNQQITLVMEDDGKGIDQNTVSEAGSGLLGLRERAAQLGGELRLGERSGGGAQLIFSVPLPKQGVNP